MSLIKVLILAIVQGLAELLPVSSSAHVVVAEKLLGMDPSSPEMTLVLVMLHTGTMFAVIVYFWAQWKRTYFAGADAFKRFAVRAIWATALTAVIGYPIVKVIEHHERYKFTTPAVSGALPCSYQHGDIEALFSRLDIVAPALLAAGLLILFAGLRQRNAESRVTAGYERSASRSGDNVTFGQAGWMGAVQGLCLPFRGFSRSGATISTGLLTGATRERAERFSFALAVIITPLAIGREALRLHRASLDAATGCTVHLNVHGTVMYAILGMVFAFFAGLAALKWVSAWLENGKWYLFGIYCLVASVVVYCLHLRGY